MMPSTPGKEPSLFQQRCRDRGLLWLRKNPTAKRPRDYWSPFRNKLADAAHNLCSYSGMYEPVGTVDHFIPVSKSIEASYDWSNYRFCTGIINSAKGNRVDILDPFAIKAGWFEIQLPSLQLATTEKIPVALRAKAEATMLALGLRDDETILRQRRAWMQLYEEKKITLDGLDVLAPLLAIAIRKATQSSKPKRPKKTRNKKVGTSQP